jgi:hypothetical protein
MGPDWRVENRPAACRERTGNMNRKAALLFVALFSARVVENAVVVRQWSSVAVWTVIVEVTGIGLLGIA